MLKYITKEIRFRILDAESHSNKYYNLISTQTETLEVDLDDLDLFYTYIIKIDSTDKIYDDILKAFKMKDEHITDIEIVYAVHDSIEEALEYLELFIIEDYLIYYSLDIQGIYDMINVLLKKQEFCINKQLETFYCFNSEFLDKYTDLIYETNISPLYRDFELTFEGGDSNVK